MLVEGLVHRLDGVEVERNIRTPPHPIEEATDGGVLPVHGETLPLLFEEVVPEVHHVPGLHVGDVFDAARHEECGEFAEVGPVEFGGARACVGGVGEFG